jgi:DNA-binding MarR family transcriptional regulator
MPATSIEGAADAATLARYHLDEQIGFVLRRAYQRASATLVAAIGAHDLTVPQFAVLARLHECSAVSQNELGRLVVMEPANVRDVVQRLKRRGLVGTAASDGDRRRLRVQLTLSGRQLIEAMIPLELACSERTLAPLTVAERRRLLGLLLKLIEG